MGASHVLMAAMMGEPVLCQLSKGAPVKVRQTCQVASRYFSDFYSERVSLKTTGLEAKSLDLIDTSGVCS